MPSEFGPEPHSPRYGPFLVLGLVDTNCAQSRPLLAIIGLFLGRIVELEGNRAIKAHVECSNRFPPLGRFEWVPGPFWAKKGCFGAQTVQLWEGTSRLGAPAPGRHR